MRTDVPIKGEEGVCVLMCLSKGRRGVHTDVPIKGDVPIIGEEGLCLLMCHEITNFNGQWFVPV